MVHLPALRIAIISVSLVVSTALLAIALSMRDHFLVFILLVLVIGLVGALVRGKRDVRGNRQNRN